MINDQAKELADLGIWVHYDENDLTKAKAMVLGPQVVFFVDPCRRQFSASLAHPFLSQ